MKTPLNNNIYQECKCSLLVNGYWPLFAMVNTCIFVNLYFHLTLGKENITANCNQQTTKLSYS
jgi:hypothetical protein